MTDAKCILVIGGTGNQGGAAARELLSRGRDVRALVRSPDKPEAQALQKRGQCSSRATWTTKHLCTAP